MPQSRTAARTASTNVSTTASTTGTNGTVGRMTRWRYQSAVQAARTLNAIGGSARPAAHRRAATPGASTT